MKDRDRELDEFWDVEALLPRQKKRFFTSPSDTSTTEMELPPKGEQKPTEDLSRRRFIPPHTADTERDVARPIEKYEPQHALIRRVRIYRPKSNYQYYESFVRDAARLYPIHGEPCERVTFFSYVPQYSQMSRAQLEWYLWWRENLRRGEAIATDYSYVLLYVYEMINLSERLEPQMVQTALFSVWEHYRDVYHQLDGYLSEWICDYSLLHHLTVPQNLSPKLLAAAMAHCTLKEFYFSSDAERGYVGALLAFCNNYDYRKSKFYTGENVKLFDGMIYGVLSLVIDHLSEEGKLFSETRMDDSKCMRNAYTGALCAYSIKRNLEVEYCSFSRSNELRYFITDVIKYTENLLRAHLGIRSKLTVYSLPTGIRDLIDAYMREHLPVRVITPKAKKVQIEEAAYERLYDLPKSPLSFSHAAEIEQASWRTTERLIEAFAEEEEKTEAPVLLPVAPLIEAQEKGTDELERTMRPYAEFLRAAAEQDYEKQRIFAQNAKKMPDVIADEINELAAEHLGDILLEDMGDGYAVIEDYAEQVDDLLGRL